MDQVSFDFIKAATIEHVKANPVFSYWTSPKQNPESLNFSHRDEYGLIVAINTGSGFRLHNLNAETLEDLEVGSIVLKNSLCFGVIRPGLLTDADILRLHKHIMQCELQKPKAGA
jgi:hypothetical protein